MNNNYLLEIYRKEVGDIPKLSQEEIINLSRIIHGNDPQKVEYAVELLVTANLDLVVKCVLNRKWFGKVVNDMDLIQEGNQALDKTARTYDYDKHKTQFDTYANIAINNAVLYATQTQERCIRIPQRHFGLLVKLQSLLELNPKPSVPEIAAKLDIGEEYVELLLQDVNSEIAPIDETNILDIIPDQSIDLIEQIEARELQQYIRKVILETCGVRFSELFDKIFVENRAIAEVAREEKVSKQNIQQYMQRCYIKIKEKVMQDRSAKTL